MRSPQIAKIFKHLCILYFGCSLYIQNAFAHFRTIGASQQDLAAEVHQRLQALRHYNPHPHYRWNMQFSTGRRHRQNCLLTGCTINRMPHVEITFANGHTLTFNKNDPTWILYPNHLCLLPFERWLEPLPENAATCAYLIAMPFLAGTVQRCTYSRKMGRRAIRIALTHNQITTILFLDHSLNTILQADIHDAQGNTFARFVLKHLKKFPSGWSLREATYQYGSAKTRLKVRSVEIL